MRVLVTGSRQFANRSMLRFILDEQLEAWYQWLGALDESLHPQGFDDVFTLVHGGAPGADTLANEWVFDRRNQKPIPPILEVHPADWRLGNRALPQRNLRMFETSPDLILAFFSPGARNIGTRQCVEHAAFWCPNIEVREFWS